jgi:hypothetical protein
MRFALPLPLPLPAPAPRSQQPWSKHIEIKYYFIRDKVQEGEVKLEYIRTDEKTTDILTKPLSRIKFAYFREKMGIMEITPLDEREDSPG